MESKHCRIGDLSKSADGIVILTISCKGKEITKQDMIEAVAAIDAIAQKPSPLLVDTSQSHSVSFEALPEMAKGVNISAVAIFASSRVGQVSAKNIKLVQKINPDPSYQFKVFFDYLTAKEWLVSFV